MFVVHDVGMLASERQNAILREVEVHGEITVTEFATRVGVSEMTVRRDLAELARRELIQRVYGGAVRRSSSVARRPRALATIGFVVPSGTYYFPQIMMGAKAAAAEVGVRLVLGISEYSAELERHQIRRLIEKGVDGLIVTPSETYRRDDATYRLLDRAPVPVIVMERSLADAPADLRVGAVRSDHGHGAKTAVQHLFESGRRRIAIALRPGATAEPLGEGYRRAMADLLPGVPLLEIDLTPDPGGTEQQRLETAIDQCIQAGADGLIVLPDAAAITALDLAVDRGLSVPGDFSIVAYDDELASLAAVPLTAVHPPRAEVGAVAVRACFERLAGRTSALGSVPSARVDLLPSLVVRESSVVTAEA